MENSANNIQNYRQMLKLDRRSRVFALLAEELCAAGEWGEAAEVCKKGLLFHPDHLRARVLLGRALMEMGETDQSERILLNIVEDIRKNSIVFKLLSEVAADSGDNESANEYIRIHEAFQTSEHVPSEADSAPEPLPVEAVIPEKKGPELHEVLTILAQRIDERFSEKGLPGTILSEDDKSMLKQQIVAALSHA